MEEQEVLVKCIETPSAIHPSIQTKSGRSLKVYGGEVTEHGLENQSELPPFLHVLATRLSAEGIFPHTEQANHVLLNSYKPGDGIMPHQDGPAYFPFVMIINLQDTVTLNFYEDYDKSKCQQYLGRILAEPGSLMIFTEDLYQKYLHGIEELQEDVVSSDPSHQFYTLNFQEEQEKIIPRTKLRHSLTIRFVQPVKA